MVKVYMYKRAAATVILITTVICAIKIALPGPMITSSTLHFRPAKLYHEPVLVEPVPVEPAPVDFRFSLPKFPYVWKRDLKTFRMDGAVAVKSLRKINRDWDTYFIMGQVHTDYTTTQMSCCFRFEDNSTEKTASSLSELVRDNGRHADRFFICPYKNRPLPVGLNVVEVSQTCPGNENDYVAPYFPPDVPDGSFVVYLKRAFWKLDPELIIEWMEAQRHLQVDKVVGIVEVNLNDAAKRVLQYYSDIGFLDAIPYDHDPYNESVAWYGGSGLLPMTADFGERYRQYTYLAVYDYDEFIIPTRGRNMKELIRDLYRKHPNASGFRFKTVYHTLSWPKSGSSDLIIGQYLTATTPPILQANKNIVRRDRFQYGGVRTHCYEPRGDLPRLEASENEAVIHHYRSCRANKTDEASAKRNELTTQLCYNENLRTTDTLMASVALNIQDSVLKVREAIFGSTEMPSIYT